MYSGDDIREARQAKRMTQADLAAQIGVSHRTVARWERGEATLRPQHLAAAERVLGIHLGTLRATPRTAQQWRVGRKVGRTVYAQTGDTPGDHDVLIGMMDTPELAASVVADHNRSV